jgi:hypothetical protein
MVVGMLVAAAVFGACTDDASHSKPPKADTTSTGASTDSTNDASAANPGPLVIVTEREDPSGGSLHYLYVVKDWPSSGVLDDGSAVELGPPGVAIVQDHAFYFYHAQAGTVEKLTVDKDLHVTRGEQISFSDSGIVGFDAEPIRVSSELAFMVDEKTAQVARWNPSKMEIEGVDPINPDVLERDGMKVQFQLGVAAGKRVFTNVNWRDWGAATVVSAAALGVFEQDSPKDGPAIVADERCAPSVAIGPFKDAEDRVYAVGDGAQGFDLIASANKIANHQCVVRMNADADGFDPDFFVDLQEVTQSPAIYMAYPMPGHKLLVSMWAPDVSLDPFVDRKDADWFWNHPPYYDYAIIDLETKTATKVEGLARASVSSPKSLIVDDQNYVQLFREDHGSTLHRVEADGKVEQVLDNPGSTNVQFLGRL